MNFSGLKRLIESADEHAFYDVAKLQLEQLGYRDLNIVDGPHDGGKDVQSDREHVQIQLSVRKDWDKKVNEEARKAIKAGCKHLLFLTNRRISPKREASFRLAFAYRSDLELTIYDSNRIATSLSSPGRIAQSYRLLGVDVKANTKFSVSDIAASAVLLFSEDAIELRETTIDSVVMAWLRFNTGASEEKAISEAAKIIPGASPERLVASSISRLRTGGQIKGQRTSMELAPDARAKVDSAESELVAARQSDVTTLRETFEIAEEHAEKLLEIVIEMTVRSRKAGWTAAIEDNFAGFLRERGLSSRKEEIAEVISHLTTVNKYNYISTIDQIFSSNTLDIFRAFGGKSEIKVVLDTSVLLPLIFGLEFDRGASGYASASSVMKEVADSHGFELFIPKPYLNEMASHGVKALDLVEVYNSFEPEIKAIMRSSSNAYVSHYARVAEKFLSEDGEVLTFGEFLAHFGIKKGSTLGNAERVIRGILESHQVTVVWDGRYSGEIRDEIAEKKPNFPEVVIKQDAAVCTRLSEHVQEGYIFATWDKVLIDVLGGGLGIYADNPGRIVDWLSFTQGIETGIDGSVELLSALAIVEEAKTSKVAERLSKITSEESAFKLNRMIRDARVAKKVDALSPEEIEEILDVEFDLPEPANDDYPAASESSLPEG